MERTRQLMAEAEALFKERTVDEWLHTFDEVGVPAGPVRYIQEMLEDEQVVAKRVAGGAGTLARGSGEDGRAAHQYE